MSAIIRYVINMIPYMMIAVPIYLIGRLVFCKTKKVKTNWFHEITLFAFVIFLVGLASQTIIPKFETGVNGFNIVQSGIHKTNLIPFKVLFETYQEVFVNGYINYFLINFLGNIILFIPFGLIIPLLWKTSIKQTILIGFSSSLFIEICQLFFGNVCSDILAGTVKQRYINFARLHKLQLLNLPDLLKPRSTIAGKTKWIMLF